MQNFGSKLTIQLTLHVNSLEASTGRDKKNLSSSSSGSLSGQLPRVQCGMLSSALGARHRLGSIHGLLVLMAIAEHPLLAAALFVRPSLIRQETRPFCVFATDPFGQVGRPEDFTCCAAVRSTRQRGGL